MIKLLMQIIQERLVSRLCELAVVSFSDVGNHDAKDNVHSAERIEHVVENNSPPHLGDRGAER